MKRPALAYADVIEVPSAFGIRTNMQCGATHLEYRGKVYEIIDVIDETRVLCIEDPS